MVYHARTHGGWRSDPGSNLHPLPGDTPIDKVYQEQIARCEPRFEEDAPKASPPSVRIPFPRATGLHSFPGKAQAYFGPSCPKRIAREST